MEKIQVAVRVPSGDCTEVPNLLGDWIKVPIAQEAKSLLVGGIQWMGGYRALLQLRRVDPGALGVAQLGLLLRAMAETLYAGLYNQPPSDFQVLWQDLSRSDQVQVRVALRLILDHALLYLRQFPTDQSNLKTALDRCDDWRHRVAEVEDKGRDAGREWQGRNPWAGVGAVPGAGRDSLHFCAGDGLGFACTAPFDLDAGRARLAGDSQHNLEVAQRLGAAAGELLGILSDRGRSDRPGLRRDLGLAADLEPHDLWQTLWTCLTEHWRNRQDGAASLTNALALSLLKRLSARSKAVPNGLAAPLRALVDLCEARYQLDKALASPRAIATLSVWERASRPGTPGSIWSRRRLEGSSARGTWPDRPTSASLPWWP